MSAYLITTTWSAGPGVSFKREHVRYGTKAECLAREREHNRERMVRMREDRLPGDKPWKWKITSAVRVHGKEVLGSQFSVRPGRRARKRSR